MLKLSENQAMFFQMGFIMAICFASGWGAAMMWDFYDQSIECYPSGTAKEIEPNKFQFTVRCTSK